MHEFKDTRHAAARRGREPDRAREFRILTDAEARAMLRDGPRPIYDEARSEYVHRGGTAARRQA